MAPPSSSRAGRRVRIRRSGLVALGLVVSLSAAGALGVMVTPNRRSGPPTRSLLIKAQPPTQTVAPGATAHYSVRVARPHRVARGISGRTNLRVNSGRLPSGTGITLTRPRGRASSAAVSRAATKLTVATSSTTLAGTYTLRVRARRHQRHGFATVNLIVAKPTAAPIAPPSPATVRAPDAFMISGNLSDPLTPGIGHPLNLSLANLESADISIIDLEVRVASVSGLQGVQGRPCSVSDFAVRQFSGAFGFTVPGSSSASLEALGFTPSEMPEVSMRDLPVNQDNCKGASLTLGFSGTATRESP